MAFEDGKGAEPIASRFVAVNESTFDMGGGVFNGLYGDKAVMELVHCTLLGNHAASKYGGAVNLSGDPATALRFYNCISRGNSDGDSGTLTFAEQLFHEDGYNGGDVNNFVADGTLPAIYNDNPTWTAGDPAFLDEGSTAPAWNQSTYDTSLGETTFYVSSLGTAAAGMLFQPDPTRSDPTKYEMLLIKQVLASPPPITYFIVCYGKWPDQTPPSPINGKLFDLHIDETGSAYNFGNSTYYPEDDDVCDLDPDNPLLQVDLDLVARSGNPDAGAYEDN